VHIIFREFIEHMFQFFIQALRFEVFTSVTMKNAVFWDVTPRMQGGVGAAGSGVSM
jgi:hypothetical protein